MLRILDGGDLCPLFTIVLILVALGVRIAADRSHVCATVLAVLAFLLYEVHAWLHFRPAKADDLLGITLRGVAAGGLMLGLGLMVIPCVSVPIILLINPLRRLQERLYLRKLERLRQKAMEAAERLRTIVPPELKPRPLPPPTLEELAQKAKQEYERACGLAEMLDDQIAKKRMKERAKTAFIKRINALGLSAGDVNSVRQPEPSDAQ